RPVLSPADLSAHRRDLRVGDRVDPAGLRRWLVGLGYESAALVQEPGTFARRGSILDLYPAGAPLPVRLDFFGDDLETIRSFDPGTQRSLARLDAVRLLPPTELPLWRLAEATTAIRALDAGGLRPEVRNEWDRALAVMGTGGTPPFLQTLLGFLPGMTSLLDHLPPTTLVILDEPGGIAFSAGQTAARAAEHLSSAMQNGELPAGIPYPGVDWETLRRRLGDRQRIALGDSVSGDGDDALSPASPGAAPAWEAAPHFAGRLAEAAAEVASRLADGWRVVVGTDHVDRLAEVFESYGVYARRVKGAAREVPPLEAGSLDLQAAGIDAGWSLPAAKVLVLSDYEVLGFRKQVRRGATREAIAANALVRSLVPGEYVVHVDHGVAFFRGLVRLEQGGVEREYLLLEYAKGEKLYVPVDQGDRVTRYGGGLEPNVTRLGSGEWVRVKGRVRRAIREMAFELIQLYAAREAGTKPPFPPDAPWDLELAASFPYVETPDQQRAIDAVRHDMETDRPMDRLVCGDVGFGKTEVALRAAFKAVNAGRQVAILVPTTVLALQHFATFSNRLAAFPVRVEMLSRLRTVPQQATILGGLADGTVDIVIGTHRLVQRDVAFKDLGLVVVDEEQRFGVRQKEFLKRLRTEVDVLTMTATPIPRTLHMALAGIRDISLIDTAPRDRLPIRTFVSRYDDRTIREAILREIDRGGQVYVVHNRVHDIDRLSHRLRTLVPEARFGVGHGQMEESVLEEVILQFVSHEFDVLISTTIIESGIDIPNVNTIVIDNADTLGLTQLYQLRGRVGRASNRAYAYLLHRPEKLLSTEAQERLEAIQEATELGAGLQVATRDLEIRGAGNMLGGEQSGHIEAIGFELYMRLLRQAVEEIEQGHPTVEQGPITLDLPLTALIPASYVADTELRLATYRRIAAVTSDAELLAMRGELEDRFGDTPDEVRRLFALITLRLRCQRLGIDSIVEREREIVIRPVETAALDERALRRRFGQAVRVTPRSIRVRVTDLTEPWDPALDALLTLVGRALPARED
ncbi:MAG: transcription-repair coupling factor, partial [Thermomicrobiales bacterium]